MTDRASLDLVFHALSDPTRRAMVERLRRSTASVTELAAPLPMTLAAVVQHVQVLERSGVVETRKQGRVRVCTLRPTALTAAEKWFSDGRRTWRARLDRLGDTLAEDDTEAGPRRTT